MFINCTILEEPPKLPATTLKEYCYADMFNNCKGLLSVPNLPATTLATGCYRNMFANCSKIIEAKLPATTLAPFCYSGMFANCSVFNHLNPSGGDKTYALPATTLKESCYESMFENCKKLFDFPTIAASSPVKKCCYNMFHNCSSMEEARLNFTTVNNTVNNGTVTVDRSNCLTYMFQGCKNLKKVGIKITAWNENNMKYWLDDTRNGTAERRIYGPKTLFVNRPNNGKTGKISYSYAAERSIYIPVKDSNNNIYYYWWHGGSGNGYPTTVVDKVTGGIDIIASNPTAPTYSLSDVATVINEAVNGTSITATAVNTLNN